MKRITMKERRCSHIGWEETGTRDFVRVSRWIKVKTNYSPCKRNPLWDYVQDGNGYKSYQEDFDPESGLFLDYFTFNGKNYALEQFMLLGNPFFTAVSYEYEEDGKLCFLSGVDGEDYFKPIYIEMDEYVEHVRVYEEV